MQPLIENERLPRSYSDFETSFPIELLRYKYHSQDKNANECKRDGNFGELFSY
jgi:hypothetical protein